MLPSSIRLKKQRLYLSIILGAGETAAQEIFGILTYLPKLPYILHVKITLDLLFQREGMPGILGRGNLYK